MRSCGRDIEATAPNETSNANADKHSSQDDDAEYLHLALLMKSSLQTAFSQRAPQCAQVARSPPAGCDPDDYQLAAESPSLDQRSPGSRSGSGVSTIPCRRSS